MDEVKQHPYTFIHRILIKQLKAKLLANSEVKLYPFSIKKGANIHGIIFGAKHPRAFSKFLDIAWKKNALNGEADFDIDEDKAKGQMDIFGEIKLTKIQKFQQEVREGVLSGKIKNNLDALNFAFDQGHIGSHAANAIKQLKAIDKIDYESKSPLVTYENCYKNKRILEYKLMKDETK